MAAPTISPLPEAPSRTEDSPSTFSNKADSFVDALSTFRTEANNVATFSEDVAAAVAGTGIAFYQAYDSGSTADSDPPSGEFQFNNATQRSATELYLDDNDTNGDSVRDLIAKFDDAGTGQAVKGDLSLRKRDDRTKWLVFEVTAITQNTGYTTVTVQNGDGPEAAPFADEDTLVVGFTRAGDKGDSGTLSSLGQTDKGTVSSGTVTFDVSTDVKQKLTVGGALTIATSNWPASGNYGELEIELVNGGSAAITFDDTINWLVGDGTTSTTFGDQGVTLQSSGTNHLLLWTTDNATTIYGRAG
jgi:hypothetical protein